ncbi:adenylate/guanylate cyclase domain-containing protein [Aporhodopirellula aestuarii]|uniref:Adenylate/guanylate cyclase domain-containing protein n=1 Tax=Aporhodopirellula aestuarii TaxID=2950107 RepID=A0ABT0UAN2_9BACT|nr:adenylate/guanylate cyclase domain-containing protein [Aporhodopirellula aestuarii]MCM2373836.1 adenylate/guanylate cyclase domain-containing protein [Aporhodopirellula aestuarii]
MPDLIAQGASRWRRGLPEIAAGRDVLLGRQPQSSPPPASLSSSASNRSAYADVGGGAVAAMGQPQKRHIVAIPWAVPWDPTISRHHAVLTMLSGDRLRVTRDPRARNPIFYRGKPRDQFVVVPGEHFVIGETTFTLARRPGFTSESDPSPQAAMTPSPSIRRGLVPEDRHELDDDANLTPDYIASSKNYEVTEMAFAESALRQRNFHDTQARIELLARLPDLVAGSISDEELFARVTDVLLRATPASSAVAIVRADLKDGLIPNPDSQESLPEMEILHYDVRDNNSTSHDVSTKLVAATLHRRDSVLHLWETAHTHNHSQPSAADYTATENIDWAFCVPLRSEACRGWVLYVTGSRAAMLTSDASINDSRTLVDRLSDDVKFAEVVGSLVSGMRQANQFQQRHAAMRRFFAPVVLDAIAGTDSENWLQPRECELSVMFCDLRGFSRTSEMHSDDLLVLLEQVSAALGVMTKHILDTEGVIGDFHGDAAMGFWGWPLPLPHGTDPMVAASAAAARAAADIRRDYATGATDFRCGIGIASGKAVAGRIGTVDQVKVTAFGPVVNLASRLEGLTKVFGVEILVDDVTARHLVVPDHPEPQSAETADSSPGTIAAKTSGATAVTTRDGFHLRTLGRVRPAGTKNPIEIFQLIVPMENHPQLTEAQLRLSEQAFAAFGEGRWDDAYQQLHELPAWDRPKDVLLQRILQYHRVAPADWDGVLEFPK